MKEEDKKDQSRPWHKGSVDCYQDRCENIPFASIGGLLHRENMIAPKYIPEAEAEEYWAGYKACARDLYGDDWQTCSFGWEPVLVLPGNRCEGSPTGKHVMDDGRCLHCPLDMEYTA